MDLRAHTFAYVNQLHLKRAEPPAPYHLRAPSIGHTDIKEIGTFFFHHHLKKVQQSLYQRTAKPKDNFDVHSLEELLLSHLESQREKERQQAVDTALEKELIGFGRLKDLGNGFYITTQSWLELRTHQSRWKKSLLHFMQLKALRTYKENS